MQLRQSLFPPFPDWSNQTVVVVASGQSARGVVEHVRGYPTIVVNKSFELVPNADILYAADCGFYTVYASILDHQFTGRMLCAADQARRIRPKIGVVTPAVIDGKRVNKMLDGPHGTIGNGGNSGFQAVNIAAQCKPARILLVGFDYCGRHWHADHDARLRNPTEKELKTWCERLDAQRGWFEDRNIEVINLSSNSALRNYRYEKSTMFIKKASPL